MAPATRDGTLSGPRPPHEDQLVRIVRATPWLLEALGHAASLGLADWCIGAGAIRNAVWDALHGYEQPSELADIDVAWFESSDLSAARDHALQKELERRAPGLPWEVTNQAAVHLWFERHFGHAVQPLRSLEEAVASWPETATSVAVRLDEAGEVEVIAPLGLDDLFAMIVRRNPARVSIETYRERIRTKRYTERWPAVRIQHEQDGPADRPGPVTS